MNILFIGDVVGKIGRTSVINNLPSIKNKYNISFTIANLENATHGKGLSLNHYELMIRSGIDCVTMGNHFFRNQDVINKASSYEKMIRPGNFNPSIPGVGTMIFEVGGKKIRVSNIIGKVFMDLADSNPFEYIKNIIDNEEKCDIHIVDFHAEATGEKMCLAKAFDGQLSAVLGTHTHVQTNDARTLPLGTGFMSDVGMCGFYDGIIGVLPHEVIERTWKGIPGKFTSPDEGTSQFNAVVISIDDETNKVEKLIPLNIIND